MESDYRHAHSVTAYGHQDYAVAEPARPPITLEDVSGPIEVLLVGVYCVVLYCVQRRALPVTVLAHTLSMALLIGTFGHHIEKHWLGMDGIRGLLEPHELGAGLGMSLIVVGGTLAVIALQLHRESMLHGHLQQPHKTIFAASAGAIYLVLVTRLNCTLGGSAINPVGGSYVLRVLRCPPILASILIASGLSVWLYTLLLKAEAGYVPRPVGVKSLEGNHATCQAPSQATHTPEAQQQWERQEEVLRWEQQQQQYYMEQQRHEAEARRLYHEQHMQMQYEQQQQQQQQQHVAVVAQQQQQALLLQQQQQQASYEQQQYAAQQAVSFSEAITLHTPQAHPPISTNVNLYHTANTSGHSTSPTRRRPSTSSCASRVPPSCSRDNSKCSGLTSPLSSSCSSSSSSSASSSSSSESGSERSYAHSMSERFSERTHQLRQRRHHRMVEMPEKYNTEWAVQARLHNTNPQSRRESFGTPRRRRRPQGAPVKEANSARGWSSASVGGRARRRSQERERPQWKFDSDNEQDMGRRMPMRQQQVAFSYAAEGTRVAAAAGVVGSWVECFDETGRAYWYNQLTQETSWTAPSARQS